MSLFCDGDLQQRREIEMRDGDIPSRAVLRRLQIDGKRPVERAGLRRLVEIQLQRVEGSGSP